MQTKEKVSLRLPLCEFCIYFNNYEDGFMKCDAFPSGIPTEKIRFEEDGTECANGIKFEDQYGEYVEFVPEQGSLLAKMHRI